MSEMIRQQYHLEPDKGLLNDPNGLSWFNGKYYVFFNGIVLKRIILIRNGGCSLLRNLFYTGNNKEDGKRKSSQCLAVTKDGRRYQKKGIILKTPEGYAEHFRDPKVFAGKQSGYYMVVGGQQKIGKGAIALCYSEDGETWSYQRTLAVSEQYEMIECPDLLELDGRVVLLFNPQKRDNTADEPLF